ncbi:hypothetical protein BDQ12DRAFT_735193 [Crucibulum laeve]|uniref:Cep57 centrosome microtubule-binding domain-containing protein n=1 Tax=Crucibulum laeve TaxID=68775 RepID=A0A5C3M0P3_9AGAR|nr:hypothetical protein BDQ12DRAFT_735193 [Crucibulum laeve]
MRRHPKGSVLDISIRGDELEQHRIQLENNLQHTDLSFRLSSASDDEGYNPHQDSSVEYPRHHSGPAPYAEFPSFDQHRSQDQFGDEDTQMHAWSYRTGDDEEGINPYGGETLSTVAHHASALTLNAGLGGGRASRREMSMSGAEYDPDRPLHEMIVGVDRISMFDMDPSKSKLAGVGSVTFDPLVVDSTAELDRILESGHAPPASLHSRSVRLRSPLSSATSSASDSDSGHSHSSISRPKLSDALRRVSFSPKRPRSPQIRRSDSPVVRPMSPLIATNESMNMPTPRPARRNQSSSSVARPEVRLQPPTPSSTSSKFTRMARGIAKEIEAEQWHSDDQRRVYNRQEEGSRPASAPVSGSAERNPFHDAANHDTSNVVRPTPRRALVKGTPRGKVHLPDVTGLTSAVESPAKLSTNYQSYRADDKSRDAEARLLQTLSAVQAKLHQLEEENGISRRRVRELELELEECKREVARERTRLMEREEVIVQQQRDLSMNNARRTKGKARARDVSVSVHEEDLIGRYKEAVEEKKALEALISSLRTHLTRLTAELSSHQELLAELRNMRESDAQTLREKGADITRLKDEVERLAGEVEVLRGVVEEGLKERRASREISMQHEAADVAMSQDIDSEREEDEEEQEREQEERREWDGSRHYDDEEDDDEEAEPFDPLSILGSSRGEVGQADKTMRTDHATLGSSNLANSTPGRFADSEEFERISAEVEERRLNASANGSTFSRSRSSSKSPSQRLTRPTAEDASDEDELHDVSRAPSPSVASYRESVQHRQRQAQVSSSRPPVTTPRTSRPTKRTGQSELETPFPQIRGERLERLFFSAPEHNAKTCTVCHRRRAHPDVSLLPHRQRKDLNEQNSAVDEDEDKDEGFVEGPEAGRSARNQWRQREHVTVSEDAGHWRRTAQKEGLPPQTVLARVIREIEDDFTHYKSIYVELADQYKDMDAVSNVPKRNILAQHLREVVDILEQKGDQIASLYDLLTFKDRPTSEFISKR